MFRRKNIERAPFDKSDLTGWIAQDVAILGYTSGLTREQTENAWEAIAPEPYGADFIPAFFRAADRLGYSYKRVVGW